MRGITSKYVLDVDYFKAGRAVKIINPKRTFYGLVWSISDSLLGIAVISEYNTYPFELNIHISKMVSGEFIVEVLDI